MSQPKPTSELVIVKRYTGWALYRDGSLVFDQGGFDTPNHAMLSALGYSVEYADYGERGFGERYGWDYVPGSLAKLREIWAEYERRNKRNLLEMHRSEAARLEVELASGETQ